MNILKIHDMVKFWIDEYQSPRQEDAEIDSAIWSAAKQMTEERYDGSRLNHMGDTYDNSQRVRDELYTLVRKTSKLGLDAIDLNADFRMLISDLPDDYKYLLAFEITDDDATAAVLLEPWRVVEAVPIDWKRDWLIRNPYRKPKATGPFTRDYYEQSATSFQIYTEGVPERAFLEYLAEPVENFIGTEHSTSPSPSSTVEAIAASDDCTVYGTPYAYGTQHQISSGSTITGTWQINIINTDLPDTLHDELAKKAAILLLERVDLVQKAQLFQQEIMGK
jgi:hypothetical protein